MELVPQPFPVLLARVVEELRRERSIFHLPERQFWRPDPSLDLAVTFHGERAGNAAGPAAGPQTQLAQNILLSWLAGARILELKTVQVNDRLEIPRPCIDATNVGYNVEWSQELRLEQSLDEYVSAWMLIQAARALELVDGGPAADTLFDLSVGYDLAGIRSGPVARWLDSASDTSDIITRLRDQVPRGLRHLVDLPVPPRLASCVTLSTFHGCPAGEIGAIVEHLFARHQVHVVVKLNPTLLGFERVDHLLRGTLGYEDIRLDRKYFDQDLRWDEALSLIERLEAAAARAGRTLGVKLTNTLVVENHRGFLGGEIMYLSGQPLHVLAVTLADALGQATRGRLPVSFSAGIDQRNFFEAVACGMVPATACTDLLRPGGYSRLGRYLAALEADMRRTGARSVPDYIVARAREGASPGAALPGDASVQAAAAVNLARYAARVTSDPRYRAASNRATPRRLGTRLALLDCVSCDKCVQVCPQDANFSIDWTPCELPAPDLIFRGRAQVGTRPGVFRTGRSRQWANYADFCNDCGNCDVFCPEEGGPYRVKPRFFGSRRTFEGAAPQDGFLIEEGGDTIRGRIGGARYELSQIGEVARFTDGIAAVELEAGSGRVLSSSVLCPVEGEHVLPLWPMQAMRLLRESVLSGVNPVSAPFLRLRFRGPRAPSGTMQARSG